MILVDTGPLVAAADLDDADHRVCVELFASTPGPLIVPALIVAEVCYLLGRHAGSRVEASFLRSLADGTLTLAELQPPDFRRMADLVEQYDNLPLGGSDASVVALAERLGVTTVMTLYRRHFSVVRPRHVATFTLLP